MYNDPDLPPVRGHGDDARFDSGDVEDSGVTPRFGRLALCVAAASALAFGVVGTVAYGVWFNSDQQTYAEAIARARQALRMPTPNNMASALAKASAQADTTLATSAQAAPPAAAIVGAPLVTSAISAPAPAPTPAPMQAPTQSPGPVTSTPADAIALLDLPAVPAKSPVSSTESRKPSVWSGQISRPEDEEEVLADSAEAVPSGTETGAAVSPRSMQRTAAAADPASPQLASTRPARAAKYAQQERRASGTSARRKPNLFARMSSFFRRVSYRQHGSGSQQDPYSHP
ncbi:hypothetical protein ACW9YQ_11225 [Paraburkholderia strydomiana]|uniref:hypothetical protein n=1 Tax=Paraburkholderia strydomiana TaxID=1245417 RepID=UPI00285C0DE0|nr:hypothetical protein [Paraburkholderia strydomiana]MDR7003335.1 hypothetical protein [Paraburkholderia strydomiana]